MTAKMLLEQYMAERHALGFVSKTDEGCIRRFLRDYKEPEDGKIVFSKEYVLEHIGTGLNQKASTVLRDVSAINGFLNFVIRKGFTAYKIPPKFMPKEVRNFRAYAMSRYCFYGKTFIYVLMLATQMLPAVVLMIPLFQTMVKLHLINSLWSLVLICTCTNLPFCMFMMMGYYSSVPRELEEAAQVDGCTLLGSVFRILIPVMLPSIVATGAYAFINAWMSTFTLLLLSLIKRSTLFHWH